MPLRGRPRPRQTHSLRGMPTWVLALPGGCGFGAPVDDLLPAHSPRAPVARRRLDNATATAAGSHLSARPVRRGRRRRVLRVAQPRPARRRGQAGARRRARPRGCRRRRRATSSAPLPRCPLCRQRRPDHVAGHHVPSRRQRPPSVPRSDAKQPASVHAAQSAAAAVGSRRLARGTKSGLLMGCSCLGDPPLSISTPEGGSEPGDRRQSVAGRLTLRRG
jgi:hypothetical protein